MVVNVIVVWCVDALKMGQKVPSGKQKIGGRMNTKASVSQS